MNARRQNPIFQPTETQPQLGAGEVHLWRAQLDDHRRCVGARGVLREILAGYVGKKSGALEFALGAHGKPALAGSLLRFDLSQSDDLLLLAVTHGREVGIDLEAVPKSIPFEMLSDHYFPLEDQWALRITPGPQRLAKFFELWTRHEAQLKARGHRPGEVPEFRDVDRFSLHSFEPAAGYAAALAVEGRSFDLSCWQF
jgi:4'-phosphopantetheinyl transferase